MNDAALAVQQERIRLLGERWVDLIGLTHWEIEYYWHHESIPDYESATMCCAVDWRYMHAGISVCCERCEEIDDKKLETIFVHELMHIFLHETRGDREPDQYLDHEERVATMLATALINTRDGERIVVMAAPTKAKVTTNGHAEAKN